MPGLADITFATDEEITRYESEVVIMAADRGLELDNYRALALQDLRLECYKDGVDEDTILDDAEDKRSLAMRDLAVRKVLAYFWRDLSSGRNDAVTTSKAVLAAESAEKADELFKALGWPIAGGGDTVVKDIDRLPRVFKLRV